MTTEKTVDFRLPLQTQGTVRDYAPSGQGGGYGPPHTTGYTAAPAGPKGVHCREYTINQGHRIALAFVVDASNRGSWFEFANETDKNSIPFVVSVAHDNTGANVIASWSGRSTATGYAFCHFKDLADGTYFLNIDTDGGAAAKCPLWMQSSP